MDKFGTLIKSMLDPEQKKRGEYDVILRDNYFGPKKLDCLVYKEKSGGVAKFFGKWNKRYLTFDLEDLKLYYTNSKGSKKHKYLMLNVSLAISSNSHLENNIGQERPRHLQKRTRGRTVQSREGDASEI